MDFCFFHFIFLSSLPPFSKRKSSSIFATPKKEEFTKGNFHKSRMAQSTSQSMRYIWNHHCDVIQYGGLFKHNSSLQETNNENMYSQWGIHFCVEDKTPSCSCLMSCMCPLHLPQFQIQTEKFVVIYARGQWHSLFTWSLCSKMYTHRYNKCNNKYSDKCKTAEWCNYSAI